MTDHFQNIYAAHAAEYEVLVEREDYQGNILKVLRSLHPLQDADVVEFGAGTGRLTLLLAPYVRSLRAFDAAPAMLAVATEKLQKGGFTHWQTEVADNKSLPVEAASADLAIQGWSFGHSVGWFADRWQTEIGAALAEMQRILRPGGIAICMETLGTGRTDPQAPNAELAAYYDWLEADQGFTRTWIRSDYQFDSLEEAQRVAGFFFGPDMATLIAANNWLILPECTGIWWRNYP
jgi:ubiquinone/menaquinone biosynthesis C-methylase UbiE